MLAFRCWNPSALEYGPDYARELIESNIEDLEDRYLAEARLEKRRPSLTSSQVRKALGLEP